MLGMFSIFLWTGSITIIYFYILHRLKLLRVSLIHEILGLDIAEMGEMMPQFSQEVAFNEILELKKLPT